jgi:hypothetical protein
MRRQGRPGSVKKCHIVSYTHLQRPFPEKRSCVIRVRLSYSELKTLREEAVQEGVCLSELVRRKIKVSAHG